MCDTMVSVTPDGVLFAKNSDRDPNEARRAARRPARDVGSRPDEPLRPGQSLVVHELLHRGALRDHGNSLAAFATERDSLEQHWIEMPPDTAAAFERSAEMERRWLADLVTADLPDVRPAWLRNLWRDLDDAAGLRANA